jgi:hypothetical protein
MQVTRVEIIVRADQVGEGNTFKYIPNGQESFQDFLVIGKNSCFVVYRNKTDQRVDDDDYVMVYNINAECWGIVPAAQTVIATVAELVING